MLTTAWVKPAISLQPSTPTPPGVKQAKIHDLYLFHADRIGGLTVLRGMPNIENIGL